MAAKAKRLEGLGDALRLLRERSGSTQDRISKASGLARAQISEYETGARDPMPATLDAVLRAMGYDFADLESALRSVRGQPARNGTAVHGDAPAAVNAILDRALDQEAIRREVDRRVAEIAAHMVRTLGRHEEPTHEPVAG